MSSDKQPPVNGKLENVGTVLVIDDDLSFRSILKDYFDKRDIKVSLSESGNHAIKFIQNQPWNWRPWLVVTDIVMDGMGGYQFIRRFQEIYRGTVPIVVISRLGAAEDIAEAEIAGASAYLRKPLRKDNLDALIQRIFNEPNRSKHVFFHDLGSRGIEKRN
jgi:two-component system, OmpR family, response regulator PfeR